MTQEIVLHLPIVEEDSRSKAMTIASKIKGVIRVQIVKERNHILVIGEGIDPVGLAKSLRKKFSFANIVSVRNLNSSYSSNNISDNEEDYQYRTSYSYYPSQQYYPPSQPINYIGYPVQYSDPPSCSIL